MVSLGIFLDLTPTFGFYICSFFSSWGHQWFELASQKSFIDDSVDEIWFSMTETFTNGERNNFIAKIIESAERASKKFDKYFSALLPSTHRTNKIPQ